MCTLSLMTSRSRPPKGHQFQSAIGLYLPVPKPFPQGPSLVIVQGMVCSMGSVESEGATPEK